MYAAAGVSTVGNVAYLSNKLMQPARLAKISRELQKAPWFGEVTEGLPFANRSGAHSPATGWMALENLHLARTRTFESKFFGGEDGGAKDVFRPIRPEQEPSWMKKLPHDAQRYLRVQFAVTDGIDPFAIVQKFPYMGFGYIIPDDEMAAEASRVFHLGRLQGIKQLSFIHDPVVRAIDRGCGTLMFNHTRLLHVLDTYVIYNVIAHNLGLSGVQLNTGSTAAISHDALTPAGGDSVKMIDPPAFDEDAHYPELLVGSEWEKYQSRYQIDRDLLVRTILGEGLLGQILDIADKSSYIARDTLAFLGTETPDRKFQYSEYTAVGDIVREDPFVCAIWENIQRYDGQLVFSNPKRLGRFLTLRALMFRGLYYNPYSRFFEYLIGKGFVKYLYQKGEITRQQLLEEQDPWIEGKISEVIGCPYFLGLFHDLSRSRIEECDSIELAQKRLHEFDDDPSTIVILDDFQLVGKSGTGKFFVRDGRKVVPFRQACPEVAGEIEGIMTFSKKIRLFFFKADDLEIPIESRFKLKEILRTVV